MWTQGHDCKWWVMKTICCVCLDECEWIASLRLGKGCCSYLDITASPCGSFNGDPSAVLEGNEMSGQRRERHSYYWMKGFNRSGCRLDFGYVHKDTTKKKKISSLSPWALNVFYKEKCKTEHWGFWAGTPTFHPWGTEQRAILTPIDTVNRRNGSFVHP